MGTIESPLFNTTGFYLALVLGALAKVPAQAGCRAKWRCLVSKGSYTMANAKRDPRLAGAPVAAAAADPVAALQAQMAELMAMMAGGKAAPAKQAQAAKAAKPAKAKARFDGHALFKQLSTLADGVEIGATGTGRAKVTAFCHDGYIVTVMSDK